MYRQSEQFLKFRETSSRIRRLTLSLGLLMLVSYFTMIVLINFTSTLDGFAIRTVSWAYLFALFQFVMVLVITITYKRAMNAIERTDEPTFGHSREVVTS